MIVTFVAVLVITFAAATSVNANPVLAVAIPVAAILTGLGVIASDVHEKNKDDQIAKAYYIDPYGESKIVAKSDGKTVR